MPFRIALSGMNAASSELSVTANNIANANTTGFKESRAHFSDVFPVQGLGSGQNQIGSGVRLNDVQQQFAQGNLDFTNNALDLAISGDGFFTMSDGGALVYSRDGAFSVDREGFVVNSQGLQLQVFPANDLGFDTGALSSIQLSEGDNPPQATSQIDARVNLPASAAVPAVAVFDPVDPESYNQSTSLTVFDTLGAAHTASLFFVQTATANTWDMYSTLDGAVVSGPDTLEYDANGGLITPASGEVSIPTIALTNGAADLDITLDLGSSTQFSDAFSVTALSQDGFTVGRLAGVEVTGEGILQARYTNGQATPLGQLALANFANPNGLQPVGDTAWVQSFASGEARHAQAGSSGFGLVQSGALEASNVDLTEQLVNMITAQRNFQANAQMISTADTVTQTVINIR